MDTASKYKLIESIINTEDDYILNEIQMLLNGHQEVDLDELPDEIRRSVERALLESERGEGRSHEEVMKDINARLNRKYGN